MFQVSTALAQVDSMLKIDVTIEVVTMARLDYELNIVATYQVTQ